ncbi:MAG: pyruvate carboxylase [Gammaproteobacteria bacterium]|nr:pyruvate carboxylase [Gammaproteobacteria bacterium]NIR83592.1 pyruvate carboxylase [Gammaproteobacteria bacterium]NIR91565.1 pyruvate carboxylase [Gammaproteobacteria bacterium]NIU04754.1 pyruvate carboxylase [Gammaproteobacteria bacterium]NIV53104.1 pyruvate carboxylase [Gammaproteobacteria bacterium]
MTNQSARQEALRRFHKILVANRSEIAIRALRAVAELGIQTVAIYSHEDRFALHRFKADESYLVGAGRDPVQAYLDIDELMRVAHEAHVDAVHPGYGFLSENPDLAEACAHAGVTFIGPPPEVMRSFGSKVAARSLAERVGVPVMPATGALPRDDGDVARLARGVGYPLMLKASWGGGGRGMRVVEGEADLIESVAAGRREAQAAFGRDEVFLEKLVPSARHVEVQILGDRYGNVVHLFERDCSVQRRNQKVVERAPAPYLDQGQRAQLCAAAVRLAKAAGYQNAGTVEFLLDADSGRFYFIEVNPRIQVEHTVTEVVTGVDLVKAQIRIAGGARIGTPESGVPPQDEIALHGHALQCRITTEDPQNRFIPDYGRITVYRGANGFGIRLDGGTAYSGALITPFYDSLLEKVTAWGPTPEEAVARMQRALREFRVRGVATNLPFLEALVSHARFPGGDYTTRFIDETPELLHFPPRRDRATRLLSFIGHVLVNGNPEVAGRARPGPVPDPILPPLPPAEPPPGTRQRLCELGPEQFVQWMREERRLLLTDTTFRDAHQSLIATRMRSCDMVKVAPHYARLLPELFSLECWGGATFDVSLRFLKEDPWEHLTELRERIPNILLQMLLRGANAVGYRNYPDNVVRFFVKQSAASGVDLFRIFDSLNWVENMRVAMDAVLESGALCEAAICYTGDITDPRRTKYDLGYYVKLAKELEAGGAHILGIKDMAGLCKPEAAQRLVSALKQEVGVPIHFHTHDTSGIAAASVIAAAAAGVDAADAAMDPLSGLTSQPNLGSIVEALRGGPRDPGIDRDSLRGIAHYWEGARRYYAAFESDMRAGAASVYEHGMPGGQYTNLREQARSLGLERRWPDVERAYAAVNDMFGDVIKVTPTSKVVGDMALFMVSNDLTPEAVLDPEREIAFAQSVVEFFRGELGQPPGGFPEVLQRKVLKDERPLEVRPGAVLPPVEVEAERREAERRLRRHVDDRDLASYLMYPAVFVEYDEHRRRYGRVRVLPTPVFFYGLEPGREAAFELQRGVTLIVTYLATGEPDQDGNRTVFFELNGQPRTVKVPDRALAASQRTRRKADQGAPGEIGAPMAGLVVSVPLTVGQKVNCGDRLFTVEAMKMETAISAPAKGVVEELAVSAGTRVEAQDLIVVLRTEH